MKKASITQTKNQLSALIDAVKQGETVLITDRGRPVARLEGVTGANEPAVEARLAELERAGIIRRSGRYSASKLLLSPPPKAKGGASALDALLAEREEGR